MIAKKPLAKPTADGFIRGATPAKPRRDLVQVIINFDRGVLERVDRCANSMGLTRSAFVIGATAEKLLALRNEN